MVDKVLSLLSLIRKANKMFLAKDILDNFRYGSVHYVFIASDASAKTKERYLKKCRYYDCPYCLDYDSESLSKAIGKYNVMTIGINDKGFAKLIMEKEGGKDHGKTYQD